MAEFAAHLTSTSRDDDENLPSLFEVLAQENLMTVLRPAMTHVGKIIAERNPAHFGWLYRFNDEVYLLLDWVLQYYHLNKYDASFGENFYGLKRVVNSTKSLPKTGPGNLPPPNKFKSLLFLVLVPYLKYKCDNLFERIKAEAADGMHSSQTLKSKLCRAFLYMYPMMHLVWEGSIFFYQLLFVFGKSNIHSPFLKLSGVHLENLTEDDVEHQMAAPAEAEIPVCIVGKLVHYGQKLLGGTAMGLSYGLSVAMFFLQFVEWWYASDQRAASLTAMPVPPPPTAEKNQSLPKLPNICPLCNKVRRNDTALSVSGYVFCYPCIFHYIRQHHTCPVTGYPAETDHLIKLYLSET